MADTIEQLLTVLLPRPRPLALDAGISDIGRQRYGTKRNVRPATIRQERESTGGALRGATKMVNPEAFHDAVSRMPASTNIEDRRPKRNRTPTPSRSDPFKYHPLMPQQSNLPMAEAEMNMTPQEQALYMRHLFNLFSPDGINNPDKSRSTLLQAGVNLDGKEYSIPTVYDGRVLSIDEAVKRAQAQGLHNFPSYNSPEEAESRYQQMHKFMERDMPPPDPAEDLANKTIQGE
jgi:hypothetical protein